MTSQIALPLQQGGDRAPSRIVLGPANKHIAEALADPSGWPFGTAILLGPPRSGKSLLGTWFDGQGLGTVIDGADRLEQTDLFHRWNRAREQGETLLLIVDRERWDIALPDLKSRLEAALQLTIGAPDDAMLAALIEEHAAMRGLALGEEATRYLVPRVSRSFAGAERIVQAIDRISLERKSAPSMAVWRAAIEAVEGPEAPFLL